MDVQPAASNSSVAEESPIVTTPLIALEEIEKKLNLSLDDWQREVVLATEPRLLLCCGRKCGKTVAIAVKILFDALNNDFSKTDGILILSRGQRQSREVFLTVRAFLARLGIDFQKILHQGQAYASMTLLVLPNGNKIYSLPSGFDGVTLRTYSFWKIYRDEDAFLPDAIDTAIDACLAIHGVQEIRASTPNGTSGTFYDAYHSGDYRIWKRTTLMCPRVSKQWLGRQKKKMTKSEFAQEYLAEFTQLADSIYPRGLIGVCMRDFDIAEARQKARAVYIGADFARFGEDRNAIAIAYLVEKSLWIRIDEFSSKYRTTETVGRIMAHVNQEPKVRLVVTDEGGGGGGGGATDMLIEQLGRRRVIGVTNQRRVDQGEGRPSRFTKTALHENLLRMMENGRILFEDDLGITRSLLSMKFKYTKLGDLTISGIDSHAAEAIVRAAFPMLQRRAHEPWLETISLSGTKDNEWAP